MDDVVLRWMIQRDLTEVLEIEELSFPPDHCWDIDDFIGVGRQSNTIGMVAVVCDLIVGFTVYELHDELIEIMNLAVHPDYRRQGVGTVMVDKLRGKVSGEFRKRHALATVVNEWNLASQLFFKSCGLRWVATERCFDDELGDDYVMELSDVVCVR